MEIKDDISEKIQEILNNLDNWIHNKVDLLLEKIHGIINSLSSFFSDALIRMIRWAATIKKIAAQNDFTLTSVKISIEPAEVKTLPIPGFPIPYLTFKMPTIDFEFGQK